MSIGTVSGFLEGICGGVVLVADLSPCTIPAPLPACFGTTDPAEACCAEGRTLPTAGAVEIDPAEGCTEARCANLSGQIGLSYGTFECGGVPMFGPEWYWSGGVPISSEETGGGPDRLAGCILTIRCLGGVWTPTIWNPADPDCIGPACDWVGTPPSGGDPVGTIRIDLDMDSCCNQNGLYHDFTIG